LTGVRKCCKVDALTDKTTKFVGDISTPEWVEKYRDASVVWGDEENGLEKV